MPDKRNYQGNTEWANNGTHVTEPTSGKKASGWISGEKPGAEHFNWPLSNLSDNELYLRGIMAGIKKPGIYDGFTVDLVTGAATGVFSAYGEEIAITTAVIGTKTFTVAGDQVDKFCIGMTVEVYGSTGNDASYTIASVAIVGVDTDIVVNEAVASAVGDGGLFLPGHLITHCGVRLEVASQHEFNVAGGASLPAPTRYDYIIGRFNRSSMAFTLSVEEGSAGLLDADFILAEVSAENVAGVYTANSIIHSERILSENVIFVGDGITSFNSEPLLAGNPIQDAINKLNSRGGGTVFVSGDIPEVALTMRSRVDVVGLPGATLIDGSGAGYTVDFVGGGSAAGTTTATNGLTGAFASVDLGSIVEITVGADSGATHYRIKEVTSATTVLLEGLDGTDPGFGGGACTYEMRIADCGIRHLHITGADPDVRLFEGSYNCWCDDVFIDPNVVQAVGILIDSNTHEYLKVTNCRDYDVTTSISVSNVAVNVTLLEALFQDNDFVGNVDIQPGIASPTGIWGATNKVGGTLTIDDDLRITAALLNVDLPDNGNLRLGDNKEAALYYDGTNVLMCPKLGGGGHFRVIGDQQYNDGEKLLQGSAADSKRYWDGSSVLRTGIATAEHKVTGDSANLSIGTGSYERLDFDTSVVEVASGANSYEISNPVGAWNLTAHRLMILDVSVSVMMSGNFAAGDIIKVAIYNDVGAGDVLYGRIAYHEFEDAVTAHVQMLTGSRLISLTNGDTISIWIYQDAGAARIIAIDDDGTFVKIKEVTAS